MRYTREMVEQEAAKLFGPASVDGVMKIVDEYVSPDGQRGRERVQMAIIRCSEGSFPKLRHFVEAARADFRDVLSWTGLPPEDE